MEKEPRLDHTCNNSNMSFIYLEKPNPSPIYKGGGGLCYNKGLMGAIIHSLLYINYFLLQNNANDLTSPSHTFLVQSVVLIILW